MKVFWSWQSDTPGKIGRHFVRDALAAAIEVLKQPEDVEEPVERDTRESLHLDHDRKGVSGSPDLAPTIFRKIDQAAVFVADVTLVAQTEGGTDTRPKRLINSNVAIEYGYAVHSLGDTSILMVQNLHYGDRDELPFDLKHKAGPIQYRLAPDATKKEIEAESAKLRQVFIEALKPYISGRAGGGTLPKFEEIPSTTNISTFWNPVSEVLASTRNAAHGQSGLRNEDDDGIDYYFNEPRVFYLRLIPTVPLTEELSVTRLVDLIQRRRLQILVRTQNAGFPGRNRYGAISYDPHGTSPVPRGFTQLFRNGEIWGVTSELFTSYQGMTVIPMVNAENIYRNVLASFIAVANAELGVAPPYQIEMGAVGLQDVHVSLPLPNPYNQVSEQIFEPQLKVRRVLNDTSADAQDVLLAEFINKLYDLAAVTGQ